MNTPTPESDSKSSDHIGFWSCATVPTDFARKLERERDESRSWVKAAMESAAIASVTIAGLERERNQLRKVCDELVAAWTAYRVFPSFANEKLFAAAICSRNQLPRAQNSICLPVF